MGLRDRLNLLEGQRQPPGTSGAGREGARLVAGAPAANGPGLAGGPSSPAYPAPAAAAGSVGRILRNSTFNLLAQGLYAASQVVVVFLLARSLSKAELGEFYTLFALILVVQLIVEAGVGTVLTHRIAQEPAKWEATTAEAAGLFAIIVPASAAVFLGLGSVWAWFKGDPAALPLFAIAGFACAIIQIQRFCVGVFRGFEQFRYENLTKILEGLLFTALVFVVAVQGVASLFTVLVMLAISRVFTAVVMAVGLQRRWRRPVWRLDLAMLKNWLGESGPLGLGDVVRRLTWQLDTVLLGLLQPPAVVGIYSVAYRPLGPLNWLPQTVSWALFPSFARLAVESPRALEKAFANSIRLLWITSLPIAVAICMCAEPLVTLLAGREYLEAAVPMRLLIWIAALTFLSVQFRFLFTAVGRQRLFAGLVLGVFALEAGIELALIPWWGYFGACAGSLVGELVLTAVGLVLCVRLGMGGIEWWALARATLAGAVMAAVLWIAEGFPLPLLALAVVVATGLYVLLCLLLGALRQDDVRRLYEALRGTSWPGRNASRQLQGPPGDR